MNLPFSGDDEFGRLHAAIRLLMPLLPAIAASSPVVDRRLTGLADNRLEVYRTNAQRVPSVAGDVIPEPIFTRADYEREIFQRMYRDIAPLDPQGVLHYEWLNSRGAIARFDRNTIEIRVLDVQECPAADLAICQAIAAVLQALIDQRWTNVVEQQSLGVEPLVQIFLRSIHDAERAVIDDAAYLQQFGIRATRPTAGDVWQQIVAQDAGDKPLTTILREGPLSRRIERALAGNSSRLPEVYRELCHCLADGRMFAAS